MKCPHCMTTFHDSWDQHDLSRHGKLIDWAYATNKCPGCDELIIMFSRDPPNSLTARVWQQVHPRGANRGPVPPEVPGGIAVDYVEACNVLPISAKASAALSRRCLQNILHQNGYKDKDLAREIDLLLNEADTKKALPLVLRETVDGIRNFGNFSAHPINDRTSLQVIDVEPHEAEWCLETIEQLFEHFYVAPARAQAKRAQLNAKLAAAGKPPSK